MAITVPRGTGVHGALDIDGHPVPGLRKFGGLDMQATVVANDIGPDPVIRKKHVANVGWTPARVAVGLGMGQGLYDWIKAALETGGGTRNGQWTTADFNDKAQSVQAFANAAITAFTVPALSGASRASGVFDVQFAAESVRASAGDGHDIRPGQPDAKGPPWLCANFRVELGALPCARVASIDAFTWTSTVTPDAGGISREPQASARVVTVPDLRLSISYADHDAWSQAAKSWFVDGNHLEGNEMSGRIVFLAADLKQELGSIALHNVGFRKFENAVFEADSDQIARFAVELYVEKMTLRVDSYEP